MVKAFDDAVFKGPLLKVQGPIKTQFGYHLIETIYRT
jgi:peptidyl-prolyl cis-trans isomerase C